MIQLLKKNKICLIVCWFGKFPEYFKLWETSCSYNKDVDFIIFTDQDYKSSFKNIIVYKSSLEDMSLLFSSKLDLDVVIKSAYKFCDFRPAFGIVFADYLSKYDFWGHCDFDQVFGNISSFLNDDILNNFEKINHNGHFTLYKNNYRINNLFKESGSLFNYKDVFLSDEHYAFDEFTGINLIAKSNNIKCFQIDDFADISVKFNSYLNDNIGNYKYQMYEFYKGKLCMAYLKNNKIEYKELMYLHFQKKKPVIKLDNYDKFLMGKCGVFDYYKINGIEDFKRINPFNRFSIRFESMFYYCKKMFSFLKSPLSVKRIWLKKKICGR